MKARVAVTIEVDQDKAQAAGCLLLALSFLQRFQHQGEDWQREVKADPMLDGVLRVEVIAQDQERGN